MYNPATDSYTEPNYSGREDEEAYRRYEINIENYRDFLKEEKIREKGV